MVSFLPKEFYFFLRKCKSAASISLTSRYLAACFVYFIYSVGMVHANQPGLDPAKRNNIYFLFGIVHLINALMFVWTWEGKSYTDKVLMPEYLNILGAVLYLWSSTYYGSEYLSDDDSAGYSSSFYFERKLEFWASFIEVFAALGWIYSWHVGYLELVNACTTPGPIPARGWTFDDPDMTANITIAIAAIVYFVYNCQVLNDYSQYESNQLYQLGDQLYLTNSILYLLASLRDCEWFWFMPLFGQYRTIRAIMDEEEQGFTNCSYAKIEAENTSTLIEEADEAS